MAFNKFASYRKLLLLAVLFLLSFEFAVCSELVVKGKITDILGSTLANAKVTMFVGNTEYVAISGKDGDYSLKISGIYSDISNVLEPGVPYPNPFSHSVKIPFMISSSGELLLSIYSMNGQKITEMLYPAIDAGSYQLIWDGCNSNGAPVKQGFYIYVINFKGFTFSGRLIKASGFSAFTSKNGLESIWMPPSDESASGLLRIQTITNVACKDFYPVRLTDIVLSRDTIIDFVLAKKQPIPFKTNDKYIAMHTGLEYRNLLLKGINLGSSPPGTFPGEIAYAIPDEMYKTWISRMAQAGFTTLRVYTLHPPVFYEMLAEYNQRHQDSPLLLFQGIWLDEMTDPDDPLEYDLTLQASSFKNEIMDVIDCIHGNNKIALRPGRAYGDYLTDVSRWTTGYVLGREIMPEEVNGTNYLHPTMNSFKGSQFSINNATASEVFLTQMIDEAVSYENKTYSVRRPVSISNWCTLDPLNHPGEPNPMEDSASLDVMKIEGKNSNAGMFAWFHAYPYYPDFMSYQVAYQKFSDNEGPNSFLGYLKDLKHHFPGVPLVIGEFGVPSSWGSAHQSFSDMDHGGYSEQQQGEKNIRLMHNIVDTGCAGGFMFAWMDEWFKRTWIVYYLEAYGFASGGVTIPTRQLWHNLTSPEQNFGLLSFDETEPNPSFSYLTDKPSGPLSRIDARHANDYFYLDIQTSDKINKGDTIMVAFDTYDPKKGESRLPNGKQLVGRSEFFLSMVFGQDTALLHVTQAYDMKGLTPYFNFTDPAVQKFQSTVSDGAPWNVLEWINSPYDYSSFNLGRLPAENASSFSAGQRTALAWSDNKIKIRIPWTMLNMYDPTQMKVIDGAVSSNGKNFNIKTASSDGIAVSVYYKRLVTSATNRYKWQNWTVVPPTKVREKESLKIVEEGLMAFPRFAK